MIVFISADDDGAKKRVETLLKAFGYSVIDLGNLRDGGLIQQAGGPFAGRNLLEEGERPNESHSSHSLRQSSSEPADGRSSETEQSSAGVAGGKCRRSFPQ